MIAGSAVRFRPINGLDPVIETRILAPFMVVATGSQTQLPVSSKPALVDGGPTSPKCKQVFELTSGSMLATYIDGCSTSVSRI